MPVPVKFRSALHSCQFPHPLQKARGRPQKTDDIRPGRQNPHIQILQEASARFPGLRKHKAGRKWRWTTDSIRSYGQPSVHKTRYGMPPGKADPGFFLWQVFHFLFLRSDSWLYNSGHRKLLRSVRKKSRSRTSSGSQVQKKMVLIM